VTSCPGEVIWPEESAAALAWQKLLVEQKEFNYAAVNCDGSYDGTMQRDRVIAVRTSLGLPAAEGVLDQAFYNCLVHADCPDGPDCARVPNVVGLPESEATAVLSQAGFEVVTEEEPTATETPGTVLRQNPTAGTEWCDTVTLTVAVEEPLTPTHTVGAG
jgi:hypothetical protein